MLRYRYRPRHRRLSSALGPCSGPQGRIKSLQKTLTEVFRTERIEANYGRCDEVRGYVERLIQLAIKHGDTHKPTMEMADYWILEKDLIHKLFKVYVPRYQNYTTSFTKVWNLPVSYPGDGIEKAVLELRGNPWPPVVPYHRQRDNFLSNVLLADARKEYREQKYKEEAARMVQTASDEPAIDSSRADNSVSQTEDNSESLAGDQQHNGGVK